MRMTIKQRITDMREKVNAMKDRRGITAKVQVFKFQPLEKTEAGSYLVDEEKPCEGL